MDGVFLAKPAILSHLQLLGRRTFVLGGAVIPALTLRATQMYRYPHVPFSNTARIASADPIQ
jgi:hypothetical protein